MIYKGKKIEFESGETLIHDMCLDSCKRKGRAHYHFIECPGGEDCYEKISPENAKHSHEKYQPDETKIYDLLLC